jgi:hypothetical protein
VTVTGAQRPRLTPASRVFIIVGAHESARSTHARAASQCSYMTSGPCQRLHLHPGISMDDREVEELAAIATQRKERYAAAQLRKRSGAHLRQHRGRGSNPNSQQYGLTEAARSIYVCSADGCCALVDAGRARACAMAAQRTRFARGDGCAGVKCAKKFRQATFRLRQQKMAAALDEGVRTLRDWPEGIGQGDGQRRGLSAARLAAARTRQYLHDLWPNLHPFPSPMPLPHTHKLPM